MVTLQDISVQLMKPAKDLADWKFPLSQILEEYYALLEAPCNINFGEAALVLQNSTNVYVRRIERLFTEIEVLKQTFFGYEEEERNKSTSKEKRVPKKAYIDIENFVLCDLEKDVGKKIDKKNQFQAQKRIKLLSHRFTQLENSIAQLCIPIHTFDVLGEIIGKKYDFRCNQAINTSGMLVDELTPYDFNHVVGSRVQKGRNSLSSYSEPKTPGTGTSGYHSAASLNDNEFVTSINEEFEEEDDFSLPLEDISTLIESDVAEKENMINGDHEISSVTDVDSPQSTTKKNDFKVQHTQNDIPLKISEIMKKCRNQNLEQIIQAEEEYEKNDKMCKTKEKLKSDDQLANNCRYSGHNSKEDELDNAYCKESSLEIRRKGNEKTKMSMYFVEDINESDWKPMPFIKEMKSVFTEDPSVLKLPEYISLLETKFGSKKRKLTSKFHKPECLTKLFLREVESFAQQEKHFISQAKQKFKRLRKQELEDFMKNFDECLNGTEKENDTSRYEAMTGSTIDLLGFRISEKQTDCAENNIPELMSRSSSPNDTMSRSVHNSFDTNEQSSNTCNDWYEPSISEIDTTYSLPDYQSLIEDKMKEIFEESNVTTDLDQSVAKWHASLQPILSEAEIRPAFRIQDYTSHIIGTLQSLDQKKMNFDNVVGNKPSSEVARYFLATLQLANTYNVDIQTENSGKSIEIALLDDGNGCEKI
ncbi:uncharacterized protein LOC116429260 [Nomia melanderi]|uniref:uncharacterized protein LOC116429260 n=1 Tax=Nomia melanderi TaxID=2448451 RepID=UPI0013045692|nr:uncharacterized protein LOC116429260 isoform X1 [Nomia melanderi]XP_031837880.1 uncharacterized protein LOC116429260 isoform X1 [Nomia melanderi]XP_031837881.1 uncharacterized protein LOC116429260 isoform X1 [Nomia melanderi]XP_031837882.1 uncharacterized protein LOC116429260 isoform X1 [Nomia melanderi]XP_031837884.1 uncharacterized protein LOC116429260 isoform X1 [Nomia melanderi]